MSVLSRPLADPLVELVATRFRVLGHPVRISLIERLDRLGEAHVQALADEFSATQQNTAKHLSALWRGGMLTRRREGRITVYSVSDPEIFALIERVAVLVAVQPRCSTARGGG